VMGAVYAIFAPMLAPFLFGKEFEGSTLLGQILCLRYAFAMLVAPVGVIGYSLGMVRIYWMINLLQLVAVVLINVLFLPVVGPIASALALLVNELIGASLAGVVLWKRLQAAEGVSHD
ncbi:MAG: hypothetical protein IT282_13895, partial [Bacteroidetes bacterium]|nr:hypothetical protein [Bacteroidota bacterium]